MRAARCQVRVARSGRLPLLGILLLVSCSQEPAAPPVEELESVPEVDRRRSNPADYPSGRKAVPAPEVDARFSKREEAQLERLRAIGYVGGLVESSREGVTAYSREAVEPGLNFFTSGHGPVALLMDMHGRILHEWKLEFGDAWPDSPNRERPHAKWWRRAHLFENGDVLAIYEGLGMVKLDRDSRVVWTTDLNAHHDVSVRPNGDVFVLSRNFKRRPDKGDLVVEDFLTVLDSDGRTLRSVSVLEALLRSDFRGLLDEGKRSTGDLTHTNTIHVLDGRLEEGHSAFRAGNVLISMNALGAIAVLDPARELIVWARRGEWEDVEHAGQHDPQILENGNMLFFENHHRPKASRIREVDPVTGEEAWFYEGSKATPFFSGCCGAVERMPNGNTLITETESGRAFEIDAEGRIVWEYYNPYRTGENDESGPRTVGAWGRGQRIGERRIFIATISKMIRLPLDYADSWLH